MEKFSLDIPHCPVKNIIFMVFEIGSLSPFLYRNKGHLLYGVL
jgi:hypothetical protein